MKARFLILAAVGTVAAALTTPAHAGVPSCVSHSAMAPYRVSQTGPDLVKAQLTMMNNCGATQRWVVGLTIETKRCSFGVGCVWGQQSFLSYTVEPESYSTQPIVGECRDGTHRYRLVWELRDAHTSEQVSVSRTTEPELTCDNDTPPPPDPCDVDTGEAVRPRIPIIC